MPKKKGKNKHTSQNKLTADFTINDCANASKAVTRVKKAIPESTSADLAWDEVPEDDFDIIEEVNADGTRNFVYKKKRNHSKSFDDNIDSRPGISYPEIVWYHISQFIKPEHIGNFAGINKTTNAITKRESFWWSIYKRYCENHPKLPERLRIENGYKRYGLRQRVIRALYHTYDFFVKKVIQQAVHDSKPHQLVKRRCISVWFCKGLSHWSIFFKFKKLRIIEGTTCLDFMEELGRIDANPEEDVQVLQACHADAPAATSQVYCGETPKEIFKCLGSPTVVDHAASANCDDNDSECEKMKCLFSNSGWMQDKKVNKKKVSDHFDSFAARYPAWATAVSHVKAACLAQDLPAQGVYIGCPAYDIMHCVWINFIRNATPSQWSSSAECASARAYAGACPVCPSSCFAPMVPYGSCNACLSLPRSP